MIRKTFVKFITWLYTLTYEPLQLDKINSKLIRPVEGLVIDGIQYYEFVSLSDMPQERFIHYLHLRQEMSLSMDRELANKYFEEMKACLNNEPVDKARLGALLYTMQDTINNCTPIETLYNLAAMLYFDKNEDLKCFDQDYNTVKIAKFKKIKDQVFFFDRLLRKGFKTTGEQSPDDMLKYLKQSAVKLKAYRQMLFEKTDTTT